MANRRMPFSNGLILAIAFGSFGWSQGVTGVISGSVTSPKAAIGGATVTITNADTGVTAWTGKTNVDRRLSRARSAGRPIQRRRDGRGFKRQQVSGIELSVDQRADILVVMQAGEAAETVTVEGRTQGQLASDSSSLGNTITPSAIAGSASAQPQYPESAGSDAGRFLRRRHHQPSRPEFFAAFDRRQPHAEQRVSDRRCFGGHAVPPEPRKPCPRPIPSGNSMCSRLRIPPSTGEPPAPWSR